jgi:hypothetical protein
VAAQRALHLRSAPAAAAAAEEEDDEDEDEDEDDVAVALRRATSEQLLAELRRRLAA